MDIVIHMNVHSPCLSTHVEASRFCLLPQWGKKPTHLQWGAPFTAHHQSSMQEESESRHVYLKQCLLASKKHPKFLSELYIRLLRLCEVHTMFFKSICGYSIEYKPLYAVYILTKRGAICTLNELGTHQSTFSALNQPLDRSAALRCEPGLDMSAAQFTLVWV